MRGNANNIKNRNLSLNGPACCFATPRICPCHRCMSSTCGPDGTAHMQTQFDIITQSKRPAKKQPGATNSLQAQTRRHSQHWARTYLGFSGIASNI